MLQILLVITFGEMHSLSSSQATGGISGTFRECFRSLRMCINFTFAARGLTDKQLAIEPGAVPGTARFHIENAARKPNAR